MFWPGWAGSRGEPEMRPLWTFLAVVVTVMLFLSALILTWGPSGDQLDQSSTENQDLLELFGTGARLRGDNYLRTAVAYAQTVYAASQDQDKPGAVVLVRDDDPAAAITTTRLQHFPVNAPMLYLTDQGQTVPEETRQEIERLDPEGVMIDGNTQIYLVGDIPPSTEEQLEEMGYITQRIYAPNAIALSERVDEYISLMEGNHNEMVLIAHIDNLEYAFPGSNWNSHAGNGFAFVTDEGVPNETARILEARWPHYPYIYVFAPTSVVNETTMQELTRYGYVQRIPGEDPQEMSVRWAGYKDSGRRVAWWFGYDTRSVGWGIAEPGHNAIVANPSDWRQVVPSGVLSHMGKHAFLLLTEDDGTLPESAVQYLSIIKPTPTHPSHQYYNYAWVVGEGIPSSTVMELDLLLRVAETPPGTP